MRQVLVAYTNRLNAEPRPPQIFDGYDFPLFISLAEMQQQNWARDAEASLLFQAVGHRLTHFWVLSGGSSSSSCRHAFLIDPLVSLVTALFAFPAVATPNLPTTVTPAAPALVVA